MSSDLSFTQKLREEGFIAGDAPESALKTEEKQKTMDIEEAKETVQDKINEESTASKEKIEKEVKEVVKKETPKTESSETNTTLIIIAVIIILALIVFALIPK